MTPADERRELEMALARLEDDGSPIPGTPCEPATGQGVESAEARQRRGAFDNTLALALYVFARQARRWQGTAEALLKGLREAAREHQIRQTPEHWPVTPVALGRQLKHLGEALARHGVRMARSRRSVERLIVVGYDPAADSADDED